MPNVWYIGSFDERRITPAEWGVKGIITGATHVWNAKNAWSLDQSQFTSNQLEILDRDPGFKLNQTGPRTMPALPDEHNPPEPSAFAYYKETKSLYDLVALIKNNIELILQTMPETVSDAVDADVAGKEMLLSTDLRVPKLGDPQRFRVLDKFNHLAFEITSGGITTIGTTEIKQTDYKGLRILDKDENIAFDIRPDGKTYIGQFSHDSDGGTAITKVHVILGTGQSNMSGRGLPISADMDPLDDRIFQYGANASEITQATVPLDSVDAAYGLSPLTVIAREYAKRLPPGEVILLIPAARGGSAIGYPDSESGSGIWNVAYTGSSVDLYSRAKTQVTNALAAAAEKWPGATIYKAGMFWHQGESNATFTAANYAARFDEIVAGMRTHMGAPNLPVVVGGMVPEWVAVTPGAENVQAAHIDTPKRLVRTGYAYGPANGGGNVNLSTTDVIHFHREGVEELGRRMLLAWDRSLRNLNPTVPHAPLEVSATVNGSALTIKWSQPMTRYTAFIVEKQENGGSWTPITHDTVHTTATTTVSALPVAVRVSTVNEYGTSHTSTPVYATIIKEP